VAVQSTCKPLDACIKKLLKSNFLEFCDTIFVEACITILTEKTPSHSQQRLKVVGLLKRGSKASKIINLYYVWDTRTDDAAKFPAYEMSVQVLVSPKVALTILLMTRWQWHVMLERKSKNSTCEIVWWRAYYRSFVKCLVMWLKFASNGSFCSFTWSCYMAYTRTQWRLTIE